MYQKIVPAHVIYNLTNFIHEKYSDNLPNSILIAQVFILKYPAYGREYRLPAINYAIEDGIK
jgi:hypothetical protein